MFTPHPSFLSVIVCVYNEELSLVKALRSLYHNNIYNRVEVIVVDDCSTNPTTVRLLSLLNNFTRFKVIRSEKNVGLSNSRNIGFENATTPYVVPLDADDELTNNALDIIYSTFRQNPDVDFIVGDYYLKNLDTGEQHLVDCSSIAVLNKVDKKALVNNWTLLGTSPCKKTTWDSVGWYNLKYSYSVQDVDFWIRVLQTASKGLYINEAIYIWNKSAAGMNNTFDRLEMIKLMEEHQEFYLSSWTKSFLYNKIFEAYYPYKQKNTLLPIAKSFFRFLNFKNKIRLLSGFFLWK